MAQDSQGGGAPFAPRPDPPRSHVRRPLVVTHRRRLWVVVPEVTTLCVHWDADRRRSSECLYWSGAGVCEGCDELRLPRRVTNWIQVQDLAQRYPVVLFGLSPMAMASCPALGGGDGLLPWSLIETWREPATMQGRQFVKVLHAEPPRYLPEPPTTLSVLRALFAAPDRRPRTAGPRLHQPPPDDDIPSVGPPERDYPEGPPRE